MIVYMYMYTDSVLIGELLGGGECDRIDTYLAWSNR